MVWPQAPPVGEGCSLRFFDSQYDVGHFPIQLLLPQSRLTLQGLTLLRRCVLCVPFRTSAQFLPPQEALLAPGRALEPGNTGQRWPRQALAPRHLKGLLLHLMLIEHPWAKGRLGTVGS